MYQSVLVPLDGSPLAEQALAPAAAIARKAGARLILVRVTPEVGATTYMPYVGDEMLAALRELYMRDRAAAHEYLATLATQLGEMSSPQYHQLMTGVTSCFFASRSFCSTSVQPYFCVQPPTQMVPYEKSRPFF